MGGIRLGATGGAKVLAPLSSALMPPMLGEPQFSRITTEQSKQRIQSSEAAVMKQISFALSYSNIAACLKRLSREDSPLSVLYFNAGLRCFSSKCKC